jgi:hypothetical protein
MPDLIHLFLFISLGALLCTGLALMHVRRKQRPQPLPKEWAIAPRPVFTVEERAAYRQLREALPHHVILAKLPLMRFCQPLDAADSKRWYDLLGSIHVSFAVCSPNGRVIAAVDLDSAHRNTSRRALSIKDSVCKACRVRYVRFGTDQLPAIAELQLLVPQQGHASRPSVPHLVDPLQKASATLAHTVRNRRSSRPSLWNDSVMFGDSFFAPDNRMDGFGQTDPAALTPLPPPHEAPIGSGAAAGAPMTARRR